ncbi:hypothetical protein B0F90DRAFT_916795 [Multifurca ochricompacta]|uniref:DnaJ-domain-containing protein n=1 Tax=Multifurca ochricompacta TaxID=376703 RepID=A0AAD4M001_9AGAM|nr:hypothetical protein B0F90DRAFT_916795 [Multifurca ochricompacta]
MAIETELYDVLGVPSNATGDDIKKAYRKKARNLHPDKNPNDPDAIQNFQELGAAYEILNDPNTREIYDSHGMQGLAGSGGPQSGPDMGDIFSQFFGGGLGGGPGTSFTFDFNGSGGPFRKRNKGEDTVVPYEVKLEDLYNGKTVRVNMEKEVECGVCKGSGAKGNAKSKKCVTCEGKGWKHVYSQVSTVRIATSRAPCTDCHGTGEILREKDRCKKCKGEKVVKEKTRQEVHVERGMPDGQRIVLAGAGDQEPGLPPGDVIFVLKTQRHKSFERSGSDLLATVSITLSEALLGFDRIVINHLDGRGVRVASPPSKVINSGTTIILRNEGMPTYKNPDMRGNLYIVLEVEMPGEDWMSTIDQEVLCHVFRACFVFLPMSNLLFQALGALLPPKKADIEPLPEIVDEVAFEEGTLAEFGEGDENDWQDEEEDDDEGGAPECQPQ